MILLFHIYPCLDVTGQRHGRTSSVCYRNLPVRLSYVVDVAVLAISHSAPVLVAQGPLGSVAVLWGTATEVGCRVDSA